MVTSNNKHDWTPINYPNTLHHNRTQLQLLHFFLRYCKNVINFLFWGTLNMSVYFHQKRQCQLVETLMFMQKLQAKTWAPSLTFWDIVKILQTFYFEYFENAWSCFPSIMIVSPCRTRWCPKNWNQLWLKKKINFVCNFLFEIPLGDDFKLAIFGNLGMLDHPDQNDSIDLKETFMFLCMQKINFITHFIRKILKRNSKLVNLGIWECLVIHTWNDSINLKKSLKKCFSKDKKWTSSITLFLRY